MKKPCFEQDATLVLYIIVKTYMNVFSGEGVGGWLYSIVGNYWRLHEFFIRN